MQVVAYIPVVDAKKVLPGMKAQVSPSTVKQEEFGAIMGTVTGVAEFPSTQQSLRGILVNDELIRTIANVEGPVEVRIDLERDANASSGYKWTSSGGPPMQISSGTVGSVMVITNDQMPISMILPWLKSLTK
jgi:HlyD family secretion protein